MTSQCELQWIRDGCGCAVPLATLRTLAGAKCCKSALASGDNAPDDVDVTQSKPIHLASSPKGSKVSIAASQTQLTGTGVAFCAASLEQDRGYWEVLYGTEGGLSWALQVSVDAEGGDWWVGIGGRVAELEACPGPQIARGTQDQQVRCIRAGIALMRRWCLQQLWGIHRGDMEGFAFEHTKKGEPHTVQQR